MIIDFHTHNLKNANKEQITVYVVAANELSKKFNQPNLYLCYGIHPWQTDSVDFFYFEEQIRDINLFAIGETGLDRVKGPELSVQLNYFERHLILAEEKGIHNIIIHNVRAHAEILATIKQNQNLRFFLHDFNGKKETIEQYLNFSNCYFSLSPNIYNDKFSISKSQSFIPLNRLFLETDEHNYSITDHYKNFAELRNIQLNELVNCLFENFKKVFP